MRNQKPTNVIIPYTNLTKHALLLDYQNFKLMIGFICLSTTIIYTCKVGTGNECKQTWFSHTKISSLGCEGDENFQVVPGSYMAHIIHIWEGVS